MKSLIISLAVAMLATPALAQENYSSRNEDRWISRAGIMFEPSVEWVQQNANIRTSSLPGMSDTSGKANGYGFGARLTGHVYEALFVGADARYERLSSDDSTFRNSSGDAYNLAPTVGLQMPIAGLRLWYSRVVAGQYNPGAANNIDLKFSDATGNRVGAGFHIMAVSLNLEYQELRYNKSDIESFAGIGLGTSTNVAYDQNGYLASVSFPIAL